MALPTYAMSCVKLLDNLCKEIASLMAKFWWGSSNGKGKIHWLAWDKLCKKKNGGGLGFKDLQCFNLAMLAKQGWCLLSDSSNLLGKVLKAKYFPATSFLNAKLGSNPSWTWRSILEGRKVLEVGLRWKIGNGSSVMLATDPWLPKTSNFKPIFVDQEFREMKVGQLIDQTHHQRREDVVRQVLWEDDATLALSLPLPKFPLRDKLIWHYTSDGIYSVKSGYEAALMLKGNGWLNGRSTGESSNREAMKKVWNSIWSLPVQGKIKSFIWKCVHNIAPVKEVLHKHKISQYFLCPVCKEERESVMHTLVRCTFAQLVWKASPLQIDMNLISGESFDEWWSCLLDRWKGVHDSHTVWALVANIIWSLWQSRNDANFNGRIRDPLVVSRLAADAALAFLDAQIDDIRGHDSSSGVRPPLVLFAGNPLRMAGSKSILTEVPAVQPLPAV